MSFNLFLKTGILPTVSAMTFYVMGPDFNVFPSAVGNYWTSVAKFPTGPNTILYVNTNGALLPSPAMGSNNVTWRYDPADPVPSHGGNNLFIACGPLDQRPVEQGKRSDVFTFTSAPLNNYVVVLGAMVVNLFVMSDRVDTDFTAKVTDVYPDGTSRLIEDGMVRMKWRNYSPAQNMTPGSIYEINVTLWTTCYVFNAGHSIRIDLSSSNYPRFNANPNNGWPLNDTGGGGPVYVATNTVFFGSNYPSRLILPTVNLMDLPAVNISSIKEQAINQFGEERVREMLNKPSAAQAASSLNPRMPYYHDGVIE